MLNCSFFYLTGVLGTIFLYELTRMVAQQGMGQLQRHYTRDTGHVKHVDMATGWCQHNRSGAGPIRVYSVNTTIQELEQRLTTVEFGGRWRSRDCLAGARMAVLVPYRDRKKELVLFLNHMHPFMQRQKLDYTVFLVEQSQDHAYNKGATVNAGFLEIVARGSFDCFIIHDVDILPEDDRTVYACADSPRNLAAAYSRHEYRLLYPGFFGGVLAFSRHQFQTVNGFPNAYWGWGHEDDDLGQRVTYHGYKILRYPITMAHFKAVEHERAEIGNSSHLFSTRQRRYLADGLSNIRYELLQYEEKPLYTYIVVKLNKKQIMKSVHAIMNKTRWMTPPIVKPWNQTMRDDNGNVAKLMNPWIWREWKIRRRERRKEWQSSLFGGARRRRTRRGGSDYQGEKSILKSRRMERSRLNSRSSPYISNQPDPWTAIPQSMKRRQSGDEILEMKTKRVRVTKKPELMVKDE